MITTFQGGVYARLVERTEATPPLAVEQRLGSALTSHLLVGRLPRSGRPVAVTRFSVGAPAIVLTLEVALARGVRTVLVCGSAGSLQPALPLGSVVVVTAAEREDGTSYHYLSAWEAACADPAATEALVEAAREMDLLPATGRSWTIDAPFLETAGAIERHRQNGVLVVEMEAAAIFAVAKVHGARAGVIVAVSDELFRPWNPGFHLGIPRCTHARCRRDSFRRRAVCGRYRAGRILCASDHFGVAVTVRWAEERP